MKKLKALFAGALLTAAAALQSPAAQISVSVDKPGHRISPTLWGIFFEDTNNSADGGIYPELVRNISFEDSTKPENWKFQGEPNSRSGATIDESVPLNPFNRHRLRIQADGSFTLENEGYWGMHIASGEGYTFKVAARAVDGFTGPLTVKILDSNNQPIASGQISGINDHWRYQTINLTA